MAELLVRSQMALGMLQNRLATFLGVSPRTMRRWTVSGVRLHPTALVTLAAAVHAKDPALAGRIAAAHGHTLQELGIGLASTSAPVGPSAAARDPNAERLLADALVCAAAEVADVSPRAMRPALAAAFSRAREAGLTIEAAHALFAAPSGATKRR